MEKRNPGFPSCARRVSLGSSVVRDSSSEYRPSLLLCIGALFLRVMKLGRQSPFVLPRAYSSPFIGMEWTSFCWRARWTRPSWLSGPKVLGNFCPVCGSSARKSRGSSSRLWTSTSMGSLRWWAGRGPHPRPGHAVYRTLCHGSDAPLRAGISGGAGIATGAGPRRHDRGLPFFLPMHFPICSLWPMV